jgi:hypothetical protein
VESYLRDFPRLGCRLLKVLTTLTCQIRITQTFTHNALNRLQESTAIVVFPLIETEALFVQIPEQMKRLNIDVGALDRALKQAPEVLQPVSVNLAVNVPLSVINNRMVEVSSVQP